jgi:hypothetical protein
MWYRQHGHPGLTEAAAVGQVAEGSAV